MSEPTTPAVPPSRGHRWLWFVWDEIKGLFRTFARSFMWVGGITAAVLVIAVLVLVLTAPPPPTPPPGARPSSEPSLPIKLLFAFGFSLFHGAQAGLMAGVVCVTWRLVGFWIIVPIVVIPVAVVFSLWLCSGWLAGEGMDALNALAASAQANGMPYTVKYGAGFGKGLHGGIEVLPLILMLLAPFLIVDSFWILIDGNFLWQFTQFVLAFALAVLLGFIPSSVLSVGVLSYSFVKRLRRRYLGFKEELLAENLAGN